MSPPEPKCLFSRVPGYGGWVPPRWWRLSQRLDERVLGLKPTRPPGRAEADAVVGYGIQRVARREVTDSEGRNHLIELFVEPGSAALERPSGFQVRLDDAHKGWAARRREADA